MRCCKVSHDGATSARVSPGEAQDEAGDAPHEVPSCGGAHELIVERAGHKALTAQIREGQGKIFAEDPEMLERQQANLSRWPERDLLKLNADAGGVMARRVIERLVAQNLDIGALLAAPQAGTPVYVYGPKGFMAAVPGAARGDPHLQVQSPVHAAGHGAHEGAGRWHGVARPLRAVGMGAVPGGTADRTGR